MMVISSRAFFIAQLFCRAAVGPAFSSSRRSSTGEHEILREKTKLYGIREKIRDKIRDTGKIRDTEKTKLYGIQASNGFTGAPAGN
jgi:hypothetical protein